MEARPGRDLRMTYYVQIPISPRDVDAVEFLVDGQMKYLRIVGSRDEVAAKLNELQKAVDQAVKQYGFDRLAENNWEGEGGS